MVLQKLLKVHFDLDISVSYVCKLRRKLGWIFKATKYGQMVRDINKLKRVEWASEQLERGETFDNVIFSDEASVEIQRCANKMYYKRGETAVLRPKPKHPLKVSLPSCISSFDTSVKLL